MASRSNLKGYVRKKANNGIWGALILATAIIGATFIATRRDSVVQAAVTQPTVVAEFDTVRVPVPVAFVPAGTRVRDLRTKFVSYPKHQVPPDTLLELDRYGDAVTLAALPAELPLFRKNLNLTGSTSNPVVERIPPGMRAMTVRVDVTSSVEGWAGSGSVVDLLLVEKDRTSVVAEKVRILSAERSVSPVAGGSSPSVPSTVTLLVTQEQCLAINTAIPLGKIAFALRSSGDSEGWSTTAYTSDRLKGKPLVTNSKGVITGYVSVRNEEAQEKRSFALSNGKWVKTETVPEGFLVNTPQ